MILMHFVSSCIRVGFYRTLWFILKMTNLSRRNVELNKPSSCRRHRASIGLRNNAVFLGLLLTTIISLLLVVRNKRQWSVTGDSYITLDKYRTSVQIVVQVSSSLFGLLQHNVVCQLFNYATRLRLRKTPETLDTVYAWNSISAGRVAWDRRLESLLPTLVFAHGLYVPSAIWAGAITPTYIVAQVPALDSFRVPQFSDSTMIKEWPSEIGRSGHLLRTTEGLFSFSPSVRMLDLCSLRLLLQRRWTVEFDSTPRLTILATHTMIARMV